MAPTHQDVRTEAAPGDRDRPDERPLRDDTPAEGSVPGAAWWRDVRARFGSPRPADDGSPAGRARRDDPPLFSTALENADAQLQTRFDDALAALDRIRDVAAEGDATLSKSVENLQERTKRQQELVEKLARSMHVATDGDGGGANEGASGLLAYTKTTNELLALFVQQVVQTGQDSLMMVYQIDNMADQMKKIVAVVDSVRQIAHQTRLLALNAAIEARKAGDAGRSFLVVADEVRHLADGSQQLSSEITELVHDTEAVIESNKKVAGDIAARDMTDAIDSTTRVEEMSERILELHDGMKAELDAVRSLAVEIDQGVGEMTEVRLDERISPAVDRAKSSVRDGVEAASELLRNHARAALDTRTGNDLEENVLESLRSRTGRRKGPEPL